MPIRQTPIVTGEYYHVYNRGINKQQTFIIDRDYARAISTLDYYRHPTPRPKFSYFLAKSKSERDKILSKISSTNQAIIIIAYCLMPNHFHLLLKQTGDNGISNYLANFQNSYTKYFNAKHKRTGALFDRQYKAVRIESEAQLLHTTRYIHLNPYSSHLLKFSILSQRTQCRSAFPTSSLRASPFLFGCPSCCSTKSRKKPIYDRSTIPVLSQDSFDPHIPGSLTS